MPLSDLEICSTALLKIGARPITSFTQDTYEAEVARTFYPASLDGLLGAHPWGFTLAQADLTQALESPVADFGFAHELPEDFLGAVSAGYGGRGSGIAYRIIGNRLVSHSSHVVLTYQRRVAAAELPPHFLQALIARLAADFCVPITESTSRAETLYRLAATELKTARLVDSRQATPRAVEDFTLIQARS